VQYIQYLNNNAEVSTVSKSHRYNPINPRTEFSCQYQLR